MKKLKVPGIRFKGFTDDWRRRKLGEIGQVYTGNTPSTKEKDNWSNSINNNVWITPTDINSLTMSNSQRHLSNKGWSKARVVPENSILITSIASIGKNAINTVPAAFNQQINAIVPYEDNAYFILSAMIRETPRFSTLAGRSATAIINKTIFKKFSLMLPSIKEQEKIGDFFKNLDNLIELHGRELDTLKQAKKSLLQHMFI